MLDTAMKISLTLVAFDKMSKVIKDSVSKSNSEFDRLKKKIQDVSQNLEKIGKTATIAGTALLAMSAVNLKNAADFEKGMANVSTLIDTNVENLGSMKNEVLEIAQRTPVALEGLTSALYDIRSAGISADIQFQVLEKSAQLGMTGLGSTSEAVDLVTSSLNAFQLKGNEAEKVYDTIFKTVKYGKTTISGIAQGFGAVAGTVSAAGIKLDDYLAAIAALTTTGQPAAQAHTQIKAAIAGMTRETEESTKVFKSLGVNNFKELIQKSGSMVNAFSLVSKQVKGNDAAILKLFGSTEAYNAVIGLTTKQNQSYIDTLISMRSGVNLLDEGYQKQFNTTNSQLQRLKNLTQVLSIELGEALSPFFGKLLDFGQNILTLFMKLPPSAKSFIAISTAGLGVLATAIGVVCLAGSKLLSFYGGFIEKARTLTPLLVQNSAKILENLGLNSTAHNITYGFKIAQSGDKFGLGSAFSIKNGIFADIRRFDKYLKNGIVKSFKDLPNNISKSVTALKDWSINSIKAIPNTLISGLNGFKNAFLGIPGMIGKAITAFRAFSITLLTSPIGWIALAIGTVVFVIYKYWKPITAFFKGVWNGLKEGLQPLMPLFKRLGGALEPIIKPIRAIIDWFKKLIKPVEDTGGKAESMGLKFGKAIAGIIVKIVELIVKIAEFGRKIGSMLASGIIASFEKVKKAIGGLTQIIRDHLPHSPAKTGPLKDLNKIKIVETIASTIKPMPLVNAMNKSLGLMTTGFRANVGKLGVGGGTSFVITYSPTISMPNGTTKDEFSKLLKQHKDEVVSLIKREFERKERVMY